MKCLKSFLLFSVAFCCLGTNSNAHNGPINLPLLKEMGTNCSFQRVENRFVGGGVPDSVLHGLRVLGLMTGCQDWMTYSHNGIGTNLQPEQALELSVCALMDALPTTYKDSFMVFDYGMYPMLSLLDRGDAHENAFQWMKSKVQMEYDPPYLLLIGKQINPEDASVVFKVFLKMPNYGLFSNMNSTLNEAFETQVTQAIQENHGLSPGLTNLPENENAGIDKLTELIGMFLNGDFDGGMTKSLLELNGFTHTTGHF